MPVSASREYSYTLEKGHPFFWPKAFSYWDVPPYPGTTGTPACSGPENEGIWHIQFLVFYYVIFDIYKIIHASYKNEGYKHLKNGPIKQLKNSIITSSIDFPTMVFTLSILDFFPHLPIYLCHIRLNVANHLCFAILTHTVLLPSLSLNLTNNF